MANAKFKAPAVRHPAERVRVITEFKGESMCSHAHSADCDIRNIIRKFDNTGLLPDGRGPGSYVDCTHLQGKQRDQLILEARAAVEDRSLKLKAEADAQAKAKADQERADQEELARLRAEKSKDPKTTPEN